MAGSAQTLSDAERRLVAEWAAACAERVLALFEAERPDDMRPRAAIARARAFAAGEQNAAAGIRARFGGGNATAGLGSSAAAAAARAAGQASAVCHMGAHGLGAAAYAVQAARRAARDGEAAAEAEIAWQLARLSPPVRAALRTLPAVGTDKAGPLGPGLLAAGEIGAIIRRLQQRLSDEGNAD